MVRQAHHDGLPKGHFLDQFFLSGSAAFEECLP
jgi:hypothetical protein